MIVGIVALAVLVIIVLYLIWMFYSDYSSWNTSSPWIVENTRSATVAMKQPGYRFTRSVDSQYGLEFTYAFWMYISKWDTTTTDTNPYGKHIMHKGSEDIYYPFEQGPGIWLGNDENKLTFVMNTFAEDGNPLDTPCDSMQNLPVECVEVKNIPIAQWVHVSMVVINRNIDIYINGRLKTRYQLRGIPRQNYGDLYVTYLNGFDGFLSKFRYFNRALGQYEIEQQVSNLPADAACAVTGKPAPLAPDWWLQKNAN